MPSRSCITALETMTVTPAQAPVREKPSATRPSFRFGVAFRLLIAFAAITAFAVAVSAVALFTFSKYKNGFNRIASSNLPALVAASDLAQRSQALAANAPNLAVVDGHFARRAVSESLRDQLLAITNASAQVKNLAPTTAGLESLARDEASLKESLEKLDGLVADKLESDRVATNFMLRLGMLSSRVRATGTDALPKISDEPSSRAALRAVAWHREDCRCLGGTAQTARRIRLEYYRASADVCRAVGSGDPERAAIQSARGKERCALRGEREQVAVRFQHEPRAAHATQCHHRTHRNDGQKRGALRNRKGAGASAARKPCRDSPSWPHQ